MKIKTHYTSLFFGIIALLIGITNGYGQNKTITEVREQAAQAEAYFTNGDFAKSRDIAISGINDFETLKELEQKDNPILKAKLYEILAQSTDTLSRRRQVEDTLEFDIETLNLKDIISYYILGKNQVESLETPTRPLTPTEQELVFGIYSEMGEFYSYWHAYNISKEYHQKAEQIVEKIPDDISKKEDLKEKNWEYLADSYNHIARIKANEPINYQSNIQKAIDYYIDLETLYSHSQPDKSDELRQTRLDIADLYMDLQEYQKSIDYYEKIDSLHYDKLSSLERATVLNNLGYLYLKKAQQNPTNSEEYNQKAREQFEAVKDIFDKDTTANTIDFYVIRVLNEAESLRSSGQHNEGLKLLNNLLAPDNPMGLKLKKPQNKEDSLLKAKILNHMAANYYDTENYAEAKQQSERAIKLLEPYKNEAESWEALGISYARLREVYKKWNKLPKAIEYDNKASEIEKRLDEKQINDIYRARNETEEREEDFKEIEENIEEGIDQRQRIKRLKEDSARQAEKAESDRRTAALEQQNLRAEAARKQQEAENARLALENQKVEQARQKAEQEAEQVRLQRELDKAAREKEKDSLNRIQEEKDRKRQEEEAKKAQEEKAKEAQQAQRTLIALIVIGFLLLIVLGILYGLYRARKTNRQLAEQKKTILENNAEIQEKNEELKQIQEEITAQNELLILRSKELKEKSDHITESIQYAQRIQEAMLPHLDTIRESLPESFVLFRPRDIVSGDFYWFLETLPEPIFGLMDTPEGRTSVFKGITGARKIITAVDCTGHGVPGAFMSMIGHELLNNIVEARGIKEADKILNELHLGVAKALRQRETDNRDGMDMALCVIDEEHHTLVFSGAKNPLVYIENGELIEVKSDKVPIGGEQLEDQRLFSEHKVDISEPKTFYVFSDGFQDQFGGPKGKKFMKGKFKKLLLEIHQKPFDEQRQILDDTIEEWIRDSVNPKEEQVDDVLVIGFRVGGGDNLQ